MCPMNSISLYTSFLQSFYKTKNGIVNKILKEWCKCCLIGHLVTGKTELDFSTPARKVCSLKDKVRMAYTRLR